MPKLYSPDGQPKILPPIYPNVGLEVAYRHRMERLLSRLHNSLMKAAHATYISNEPMVRGMAIDASPATAFVKMMRVLSRKWLKNFSDEADKIGTWFTDQSQKITDTTFKKHLSDIGFTVKMTNSAVVRDVLKATLGQQVNLIKSIGERHLRDVETAVLASVQSGGDLFSLTNELETKYDLSRKRAAFIAVTENKKASANIQKVRMKEAGIQSAIWLHSKSERYPRPKHVAFSGQVYDINIGAPIGDNGENVLPGVEYGCMCIGRAIIPGL